MKEEEQEEIEEGTQAKETEREFYSGVKRFAKKNPEKVHQIVAESEWGKKRNRQLSNNQRSLFDIFDEL